MTETNTSNNPESIDQFIATFRDLKSRIEAWWKRDGLGHISELKLTGGGLLELELNCSLYTALQERMYDGDKSLPREERRALAMKHFEAKGLVLHTEPGDDATLVYCDATREALTNLVQETFPSAVVWSMTSQGTRHGHNAVQNMTIFLRDLKDVLALPLPTPDEL